MEIVYGVAFKKRAPRAVRELRKIAGKVMGTPNDVRVESKINKAIWAKGVRNLPRRIRVRLSRKRNESDGAGAGNKSAFYTLIQYVPVERHGFKRLQTENVTEE